MEKMSESRMHEVIEQAGKKVYEADSEASTIRVFDADPAGGVASVAGSNDLFGFGLVNAVGKAARFQHPLGVALDEAGNRLFVADSFNNVIRVIDLQTKQVETFLELFIQAFGGMRKRRVNRAHDVFLFSLDCLPD